MNYYELIYLKNEFKNKLVYCVLDQAITPYKNILELYIIGSAESFRLILSVIPGNTALFLDTFRPGKKSNKLLFFTELYGVPIVDIVLAEQDRIISILFENGKKITFKLFSNKANAILINEGEIIEVFKDFDEIGTSEPKPKVHNLFSDVLPSDSPKQIILRSNPLLPRSDVDLLISLHKLEHKSAEEIVVLTKKVTSAIEHNPVFRKLENGITTQIPFELLPLKTSYQFSSVNELIAFRFKNYSHYQRLSQQKAFFRKKITQQLKRIKSVINNLSQADKGIEKSELFTKYGHLLMSNAHLKLVNSDKITVVDFYEENSEIEIPLDIKLTIAENAELYYNRASSSIQSFKDAKARLPNIEARRNRLERMQLELEKFVHLRDLEDWKKKNNKELEQLDTVKTKKEESSLPFHTLEIQGYQIWIGKNAKSNDKLIQFSHKEDVWMHARGVPGSHLVIRMGNKKEMPPKNIIQKAASFAAFNSKAKGADLVPVIFTKRKYVRKPKGAAAGAVLVQKEEVELVKPMNPIV